MFGGIGGRKLIPGGHIASHGINHAIRPFAIEKLGMVDESSLFMMEKRHFVGCRNQLVQRLGMGNVLVGDVDDAVEVW